MPGIGGEMVRSTSMPGLGHKRRKERRPRDGWMVDWQASPTTYAGPRWSLGKDSHQTSVDRSHNRHSEKFEERKPFREQAPRFRDTWIQKHMRESHWQPGPGTYRTQREFMDAAHEKDNLDSNKTIQEEAPCFSFARGVKETSLSLKDFKEKKSATPSPGPGSHLAYTTFGVPSGPSRKQYLGGNPSSTWDASATTF
eukprot:TRINITY_DN46209_c0_g1_i1.p1 TRINITY_DN46209_c0_g1~~TRINITY_DN46209_c0_g1_i1.p1  ORF type:complete len:197 (+),score=22.35 TRINITY_DN46209_c0_g1_i1:174-764(+)